MTTNSNTTENKIENKSIMKDGLSEIIIKLNKSANGMHAIGTGLFIIAIWLSFAIFIDIKNTTITHLNFLTSKLDSTLTKTNDTTSTKTINNNEENDFSLSKLLTFESGKANIENVLPAKSNSDVTARVIYLVVRTTGLTAIVTAFFYFLFGISRAFFDQGSRTIKRRNGALYLKYLFDKYDATIKKEVTLPEIMSSFEHWNKTVESAFTQNPIQNKKSEDDKK